MKQFDVKYFFINLILKVSSQIYFLFLNYKYECKSVFYYE